MASKKPTKGKASGAPAKSSKKSASKESRKPIVDTKLQRGSLKNSTKNALGSSKANAEGNPSSAEPQSFGGSQSAPRYAGE